MARASRTSSEAGFSLIEMLIAMTVTVTALGIAASAMKDLARSNDGATLLADVNLSLRTAVNLMTRDVMASGRGIPVGGVSIPSGVAAQTLVRPSPPGSSRTFPPDVVLPAVSPGDGAGPSVNGRGTDMISILVADDTLALNTAAIAAVAADGSAITMPGSMAIDGAGNGVVAGDLIMLSDANGRTALQMVSGRNGQVISFASGDAMRLNQRSAGQGTVMQLQRSAPMWATRVLLVSYYINANDAARPLLVRRVNLRPERVIGVAVENLQVTYDLVDGVTNPVNVPAPLLPLTPNQIRKANVFLSARSHRRPSDAQQYLRSSISTEISLRSLSFVDRYQ